MGRMGRVAGFVSDEAREEYLEAYDKTMALSPVAVDTTEVVTPFGTTWVASAGPVGGPPLVVLHGKNCSSSMWLDLLPTLTVHHRAHLVDCSGDLGRSVPTRMLVRSADVGTWLDAVLDGLGIDHAPFIGFSNGAFLSATYAVERPARVDALALLAPAGAFGGLKLSWWRSMAGTLVGDSDAKMARFWARHYVGVDPSPLRQRFDAQFLLGSRCQRMAMRDMFPRKWRRGRLARLTMPALVVFAADDIVCDGPAGAARAREVLPHAHVELLPASGHFVVFDRPDEVATLLASFLAPGGPAHPGVPPSA